MLLVSFLAQFFFHLCLLRIKQQVIEVEKESIGSGIDLILESLGASRILNVSSLEGMAFDAWLNTLASEIQNRFVKIIQK